MCETAYEMMLEAGDDLAARVRSLEEALRQAESQHPMKDHLREQMHRRAQVAEGALSRARFWIECIMKWTMDRENQDVRGVGYVRAIARYATHEINAPPHRPHPRGGEDVSDGGWTLGILTWALILGGAAAYALIVKRRMGAKPLLQSKAATPENAPDMRAILQRQALQAEEAATYRNASLRLERFLDAFARRLMEKWAGLTYGEARKHARDCLDAYEMHFPDPEYDWSEAGARELADTYADENGEHYGANG
jgi:hypothetical protein